MRKPRPSGESSAIVVAGQAKIAGLSKVMVELIHRGGSRVSASVIREARIRELDSRWLDSAGAALPRRYQGKYVAVKNKRIVAASFTMRGLYRKLDELGTGMVLIAKVERPVLVVYAELY